MAAAPAPTNRLSPIALAVGLSALLAVLVGLVFGAALGFDGAILDDGRNLVLNPHVGSLSAADVRWALGAHPDYAPRYIPLAWLSIDVQLAVLGLAPLGLHFASLALHAINTVGLAWVMLRFAKARTLTTVSAAFVAAAFYGLHPMRAELAGWASCVIWQRAVFFLLVWAWLRGANRSHPIGEALAYLASLLCYPVALGLAPGLLVADGLRNGWRVSARRNAPILAIALLCGAATLIMAIHGAPADQPAHFPIALRAAQGLAVAGRGIGALILPLSLNPYVQPLEHLLAGKLVELLGAAIVLAAVGLALIRRGRILAPWLILYLALVGPFTWVTSWQDPQIPDRYFTAAHLLLAVGLGLWLIRQAQPIVVWGAGAVVLVLAFFAHRAVADWRNETALFTRVEASLDRQDPDYARKYAFMHYHVALDQYDRGHHAEALRIIAEAIAADPSNPTYPRAAATMQANDRLPSATVLQHQTIAHQAFVDGNRPKADLHVAEVLRLAPHFYDHPPTAAP